MLDLECDGLIPGLNLDTPIGGVREVPTMHGFCHVVNNGCELVLDLRVMMMESFDLNPLCGLVS